MQAERRYKRKRKAGLNYQSSIDRAEGMSCTVMQRCLTILPLLLLALTAASPIQEAKEFTVIYRFQMSFIISTYKIQRVNYNIQNSKMLFKSFHKMLQLHRNSFIFRYPTWTRLWSCGKAVLPVQVRLTLPNQLRMLTNPPLQNKNGLR
jgi:hypothetical protein